MASTLSTEENVTAFFVDAIKTIQAEITIPPDNVHAYLLEYCDPERYEDYLLSEAQIDTIRAAGVMTTATEEPTSEGGGLDSLIVTRTYTVRVQLYFDLGFRGEGIHQLTQDARRIRKMIYDMGSDLKKLVSIFSGVSGPSFTSLDPLSSTAGRIIVAEMVFTYLKIRPDF